MTRVALRGVPGAMSRRHFLTIGAVGGLGLDLGTYLALRAGAAETSIAHQPGATQRGARSSTFAKNVIHIFLPGGLSAQESFDPKPLAPIEYRGELQAISTKLTGVQFSELLPQTASIADRLTIVRSMTHDEAAHERGQQVMLTGYRPSPALEYPSLGSVVSHELGPRANLPAYICVPNASGTAAGAGYLSAAHAPFELGADPAQDGYAVRDLASPKGVDAVRDERRRKALATTNRSFVERVRADEVTSMSAFYERAFDLMASPAARAAFQVEREDRAMRDRYGRNEAGQRMLLARRLVEAGTRFVTLTYGGWDHHEQVTSNMGRLMPALDQGLVALIVDLDERGLLEETLVMVTSEFGRTPKLNQDAGRDHWSKAFSVALAGGGIQRGVVVGFSGSTGAEPEDVPITPEDLAATIYHQLGISAKKKLMAPGLRPVDIVKDGRVRDELLA